MKYLHYISFGLFVIAFFGNSLIQLISQEYRGYAPRSLLFNFFFFIPILFLSFIAAVVFWFREYKFQNEKEEPFMKFIIKLLLTTPALFVGGGIIVCAVLIFIL